MRNIESMIRPCIFKLHPYSSARDEFHGKASVLLDANENPFDTDYNRYPDPHQLELKEKISRIKRVRPENLFLGNGSDEAIDLSFRIFCNPAEDNVVALNPTYGMYEVCAEVNDIEYRPVDLNAEDFSFTASSVMKACDDRTKMIFLCSPNNPTGNLLNREEIYKILDSFDGIVIIDEAYNDFSGEKSFIGDLDKYSRLIVFQTLSKAWGGAGIRLGMAFASEEIISYYNRVKYPYNINRLTQSAALKILSEEEKMRAKLERILSERDRMFVELQAVPTVEKVYPSKANFFLIKIKEGRADDVYGYLINDEVVVRNRTNVDLCSGCLRVAVGTPAQNNKLLSDLKNFK